MMIDDDNYDQFVTLTSICSWQEFLFPNHFRLWCTTCCQSI